LIAEEAQFLRALEAAAAERMPAAAGVDSEDEGNAPDGTRNPAWHTPLPYLRLYCCMTLDEVKVQMADQFRVLDKDQLSARNSDVRPPNYFELLADKWNDASLNFTTERLPELHSNLADPILLSFEDMPGKTNPEQIKRKVAGSRASLAQVSTSKTLNLSHVWPLTLSCLLQFLT
jgi:hypothetical protein